MLLLSLLVICVSSNAVTVYETVAPTDLMGGGWDVNIFADDVHFHHGGIITNVVMNLAIKGDQQCRLWIFDGLTRAPIYSTSFTNRPTEWGRFVEYNFPLHLDVPKDIYIGFSAQGDGWTVGETDLIDFSDNATNVASGIAKTPGVYWWGSLAGGILDQSGNFGSDDYFRLRVDMLQPVINDFIVTNNTAALQLTNLSANATYLVERSQNLNSNIWETAGEFTSYSGTESWSEELSNSWSNMSYRIQTKIEE